MKKIFTTISICLILYFGILEYYKNNKQDTNKEIKQINNSGIQNDGLIQRTLSKIIVDFLKTEEGQNVFAKMVNPIDSSSNNLDKLIFKMNNTDLINNIFKILDFGQKNSDNAICGDVVDIEYKLQNLSDRTFETKREIVELGSPSLGVGLSTVIVGMSEGQRRTATIPGRFLPNKNDSIVQSVEVNLNKIVSKQLIDKSKIKIFDNMLTHYVPYLCGEDIKFEIKISKMDGTEIFKSNPGDSINYRIGDRKFPLIFAYALFNKMKTGIRTIITPGSYLRSFDKDASTNFNLKIKNSEYYIIDVENRIN